MKTSLLSKFCWILLPQLLLLFILASYIYVGAIVFCKLDTKLGDLPLREVIQFVFETITTIGYGKNCPSTDSARLFSVFYSIIGIPLCLLTLANLGKFVTKLYWYVLILTRVKSARSSFAADARMPIPVIIALFALTFVAGGVTIEHNGEKNLVEHVYFSFISFTTVGFGDKTPLSNNDVQVCITILYLTWGVMLMSTLFAALNDYLRKIHYLGRRFRGARDVQVWMGGQSITVSQLLMIVGNEFDASPKELRHLLRDLDSLIYSQNEQKERERHGKGTRAPLAHLDELDDFDAML